MPDETVIPSIPTVPTSFSEQERKFLLAIKEVLEVRNGVRGNSLDTNVTFRDLQGDPSTIINTNKSILANRPTIVSLGSISSSGGSGSGSGSSGGSGSSVELDFTTPPVITSFTVNGAYSQIILTWDMPAYTNVHDGSSNHAYVEVWRSVDNVIGHAALIGDSSTFIYPDSCGENHDYYYWVRSVSKADVRGAFNAIGGTHGATSPNVPYLLGILSNQLTSSQLAASLANRINVIDNNLSSSSGGNLVDSSWWGSFSGAPWSFQTPESAFNAESNHIGSIDNLLRMTAGAGGQPFGDYDGGWGNGTFTSALDTTKTYRFIVPVKRISSTAGNYFFGTSNVCNLNTAVINGNPYFAAVGSTVLPVNEWCFMVGYIYPAGSTGKTNEGAGVYNINTGDKYVSGIEANYCFTAGGAVSHRAYQFYMSNGAVAVFGKPIVHLVDGTEPPFNSLRLSAKLLESQYTVKIDSNGYVSGFGLANTLKNSSPYSTFTVRADTFSVGSPSQPTITPFIVQSIATTINGVSVPAGVYMNSAYIENGTITNAKVGNAAIDNAKIVDATIQSAKIANLTADKILAGRISASEDITIGTGANTIHLSGTGSIYEGASGYASGNGFWLGENGGLTKLYIGTPASYVKFNGSTLEINTAHFTVDASGNATFSGALSAATGTFSGTVNAGDIVSPYIHTGSYTTSWAWPSAGATGYLLHPNGLLMGDVYATKFIQMLSDGTFNFSSGSCSIVGNGSSITVNGALIATGNVLNNAITNSATAFNAASVDVMATTATLLATLSITSTGGKMYVTAFTDCKVTSSLPIGSVSWHEEFELRLDGASVVTTSVGYITSLGGAGNVGGGSAALSYLVSLSAGAHTFTVYGKRVLDIIGSGGTNTAIMSKTSITALELKR